MSWHGILSVALDADYAEIRAAFKRRVLETHPDKGGSSHEFQQVMLAFERATCTLPTLPTHPRTHEPTNLRTREPTHPRPHARIPPRTHAPTNPRTHAPMHPRRHAATHQRTHTPTHPHTHASTNPRSRKAAPGPSGRRPRRKSILCQLHSCLQRLPRESRKVALCKHLKQWHRLELEAWITSHTESAPPAPDRSWEKASGSKGHKQRRVHPDEVGEMLLAIADIDDQFTVQDADSEVTSDTSQRPQKGIIRRPGRTSLYLVLVVVHNIELFSAGTTDLANAVDLHIALTALKRRITKNPALMERFHDEVEYALREHDISPEQARLSVRIHFPVHHWTGRGLRSPTYRLENVQNALALWKDLQQARLEYTGFGAKKGGVYFLHTPASVENAWKRISAVYIEAWKGPGWTEKDLGIWLEGMRRGHMKSSSCQLTVWNQYRMECEDRRQRLCERIMRQFESRERRLLAKEDRRSAQIQAKSKRLLGKIDALIACLEARPNKGRSQKKSCPRMAARKRPR